MFRLVRMARMAHGKQMEAVMFSHEAARYLNETYGLDYKVFTEPFGEYGVIHWACDFASMADVEAFRAKLMADDKYLKMEVEAAPYFIEGSVKDLLLTELYEIAA